MDANALAAGPSLAAPAFDNAVLALANRRSPLARTTAGGDPRQAAEAFEAFFISQTLSDMFAGIETDPLFGGGPGETIFRSLMIDEYGKAIARSGGVGIADNVLAEIIRMQETRPNDR